MEIRFANAAQCKIADLIWEAQSREDVDKIIRVFGHDARVVYNMIVAASFDQVDSIDEAEAVLRKFQ